MLSGDSHKGLFGNSIVVLVCGSVGESKTPMLIDAAEVPADPPKGNHQPCLYDIEVPLLIQEIRKLADRVREDQGVYLNLRSPTMPDILEAVERGVGLLQSRLGAPNEQLELSAQELRSAWTEVGQEDLFEKAV